MTPAERALVDSLAEFVAVQECRCVGRELCARCRVETRHRSVLLERVSLSGKHCDCEPVVLPDGRTLHTFECATIR